MRKFLYANRLRRHKKCRRVGVRVLIMPRGICVLLYICVGRRFQHALQIGLKKKSVFISFSLFSLLLSCQLIAGCAVSLLNGADAADCRPRKILLQLKERLSSVHLTHFDLIECKYYFLPSKSALYVRISRYIYMYVYKQLIYSFVWYTYINKSTTTPSSMGFWGLEKRMIIIWV